MTEEKRRGRPPMDDVKKHLTSLEAGVRGRLKQDYADKYAFTGGSMFDKALYNQRAIGYEQRQHERASEGTWGMDGDILHLAYRAAASEPGYGRQYALTELAITAMEAAIREERKDG